MEMYREMGTKFWNRMTQVQKVTTPSLAGAPAIVPNSKKSAEVALLPENTPEIMPEIKHMKKRMIKLTITCTSASNVQNL